MYSLYIVFRLIFYIDNRLRILESVLFLGLYNVEKINQEAICTIKKHFL